VATEQGVVIKTADHLAVVKTKRSEACEGCSSKDSCSTKGNDMEVDAVNRIGAKIGDGVVIQIQTRPFLKATFLLYVFPIVCMILGAVLGEKLAPHIGFDKSALSAILGFLCFFLSIGVVKTKGRQMGENEAYHPKIIRILKKTVQ
jgi:sigma-E factor negative regulatory protein RseC